MQHLRRNSSVLDNSSSKKVPLNTIVLPPLSPPLLTASGTQLLGTVVMGKSPPSTVNGDVVTVTRSQEVATRSQDAPRGPEHTRVLQLEQNIRFLQEQHQLMLTGLHNEIEGLRNRNREFQFQLVFAKGAIPSTPSSPDDDSSKHKLYSSPKPINITPLQIEILEKELGELKIQLQETESRTVYLSAIVDEQRKKLEHYERDQEREREKAKQPDPELLRKLEDAEAIIRRLRRENSDLRRENNTATSSATYHNNHHRENGTSSTSSPSSYQQQRNNGGQNNQANRSNNGRHRGNYNRGHWFPPLHTQSYWQNGGRSSSNNERNASATLESNNTSLPSLQQATNSTNNSSSQYQGSQGGRRGHYNNNHYHNGEGGGRKYSNRGHNNKSQNNQKTPPSSTSS